MKSNEEFIAGIYEKAAAYTEEKQHKVISLSLARKVSGIAAAVAVCLCLAGAGSSLLRFNGPAEQGTPGISRRSAEENSGIAMHSGDTEFPADIAHVTGEVCLKGIVEEFLEEEQMALILLEAFGENRPEETEKIRIAVRFKTGETLVSDRLMPGTQISVCAKLAKDCLEQEDKEHLLVFEVTNKETIRIGSEVSGE